MTRAFLLSLTLLTFMPGRELKAQDVCRQALDVFLKSQHIQGSRASEDFMDSLLRQCPALAIVWREKSVPYLKRGDFATWYSLMGRAVELEPAAYLPIRGWCLIKFLHDYTNGLNDLKRYDSIVAGSYKVVDDTHIKIWMALAYQGLNKNEEALRLFNEAVESTTSAHGANWLGTYDLLYRGILKIQMGDFRGAVKDFDMQIKQYDKLSDAYYYRGIAFLKLGSPNAACEDFHRAITYYKQGYFHDDPYVQMPGQISAFDIELYLKKCH